MFTSSHLHALSTHFQPVNPSANSTSQRGLHFPLLLPSPLPPTVHLLPSSAYVLSSSCPQYRHRHIVGASHHAESTCTGLALEGSQHRRHRKSARYCLLPPTSFSLRESRQRTLVILLRNCIFFVWSARLLTLLACRQTFVVAANRDVYCEKRSPKEQLMGSNRCRGSDRSKRP